MRNLQIAYILANIADMLEIKGENFYKVRAYRKASHIIKNLSIELGNFVKQYNLQSIEGIGKALSKKIQELLDTGECEYYKRLKEEVPQGLVEMLKIPGLGPKKIQTIHDTLGISTIKQLEHAAKKDKLRKLPGFGIKTQQTTLRGIQMIKKGIDKVLYPVALAFTQQIILNLVNLREVEKISLAGSLRRKKEVVEDIDILVASFFPKKVIRAFVSLPQCQKILAKGDTKASIIFDIGIQVDLRVVKPESFYCALQYFTGSKEHNTKLRSIALKKGLRLNEYSILDKKRGKNIYPKNEHELYKCIGLDYIPPELREDRGEIKAAMDKKLPKLLCKENIKGDLHIHSNFSDGTATIEKMVDAAKKMGYEYIAITDHSKSLKIARGLDEKRLEYQIDYINELNKKMSNFKILTGIEVDILLDGTLDFSNRILKKLDIVIASIHTGFKQDKSLITNRLISACKNPYVDIIAHPTGRLLTRRPAYNVDMDSVLKVAADTRTILEINSSPQRLDLNDILTKKAKKLGIKIAINTDAHSPESLKDIVYGVGVARRGWLEIQDVINTLPLKQLLNMLKRGEDC